jgi:hypothetical protein
MVTLEQIWQTPSLSIIKINTNPLVNKVNRALLYNGTGDLDTESAKIVSHSQFKAIALQLGRLEDIKAKISMLIYLNPLFNEENLLRILGDYNPVSKLYVKTGMFLEVRNVETFHLEKSLRMDADNYDFLMYYKDRLYMVNTNLHKLVWIDLASGERTCTGVEALKIHARFGGTLYYDGLDGITRTFDLETNTAGSDIITHDMYFSGDLVSKVEKMKEGNVNVATYDSKSLKLLDDRVLKKSQLWKYFSQPSGKVHNDRLNLNDLSLFGSMVECETGGDKVTVHCYGDKTYVTIQPQGEFEVTSIRCYEGLNVRDMALPDYIGNTLFYDDKLFFSLYSHEAYNFNMLDLETGIITTSKILGLFWMTVG